MNNIFCQPAFENWGDLISKNIAILNDSKDLFLVRSKIREQILACALQYTKSLINKAKSIGIELNYLTIEREISNPIIATGHQPIVYHAGIIAKNILIEKYSKTYGAIGVNVIIDTDQGEKVSLSYPLLKDGALTIQKGALTQSAGTYLSQKLITSNGLLELLNNIKQGLSSIGYTEVSKKVEELTPVLPKLAGMNVSNATALLRIIFSPTPNILEIPISLIVELPSVKEWILTLLSKPDLLLSSYNLSLDRFRAEHKIKNIANPFPNLKLDIDRIEMPFWIVTNGASDRSPLYVDNRQTNQDKIFDGGMLVPKASIITFLLRYMFSDLFVHGKGGAKYDQFTDLFVNSLTSWPAPNFVVASQDQYLFNREIENYENQQKLLHQRRDMYFHIEKYLNNQNFSSSEQEILLDLINQKSIRIDKIKVGQAKRESTALLTKEVKAIEAEIKTIIDRRISLPSKSTFSKRDIDIWYHREFPFLFF